MKGRFTLALGRYTILSLNLLFSKLLNQDIGLFLISIYLPIGNITNIGNILVQQEPIFLQKTVLTQLYHKNWRRKLYFGYLYDDDYSF